MGRPRKERIVYTCEYCKRTFGVLPSQVARQFCSLACMSDYRRDIGRSVSHFVRSKVWRMGKQIPSPSAMGLHPAEYEAPRYRLANEDGRTRPKLPFDYFDRDSMEEF